jgi:myo-inositol-1(or 4)-monophosphatase
MTKQIKQPTSDLISRLDVAIRAAHAAGEILRAGFQTGMIAFGTKSNRNDVVTEFDLRADRAIADIITTAYPDDGMLSEESGQTAGAHQGQWVVDPLDGTNNFSQNIPHFGVSIAFCDGHVSLVGCIHDPIRNETFTAIRGAGAKRNQVSLSTSSQQTLDGAFLCAGTSTQPALRETLHQQMPPFLRAARALRTTGSAALDLAYVAAGRFDAMWYPELSWWDVAAGILLIEEAGGRCTDYCGKTLAGMTSSTVASNGILHNAILKLVKDGCHGQP